MEWGKTFGIVWHSFDVPGPREERRGEKPRKGMETRELGEARKLPKQEASPSAKARPSTWPESIRR